MEVKFRSRLGRGKFGAARILNTIVTVTENVLEHDADQKHAEIDESSKEVLTLGVGSIEGGQVQEGQAR
jgi:hypothetical protein